MSRLVDLSKQFRDRELARNEYDNNDQYLGTHPNSLSDGDEKGKGELSGSIGSRTDILTRKRSTARNLYNEENPYNISNA